MRSLVLVALSLCASLLLASCAVLEGVGDAHPRGQVPLGGACDCPSPEAWSGCSDGFLSRNVSVCENGSCALREEFRPCPYDELTYPEGVPPGMAGAVDPASFLPDGLLAADSPLVTPVAVGASVDSRTAAYVQGIIDAAGDDGSILLLLRQYTSPVYFASPDSPRQRVMLSCGPAWQLGVQALEGVPLPEGAAPSEDDPGGPDPVGCGEASVKDNHMVILDLDAGCEYDFWQMRKVDGSWVASWGNALPLGGSGIYPTGLSTRGSGIAFSSGLIWPAELARGRIAHALVFSYPFTRSSGPVPPATESDGESKADFALPEGAHVQLDPALDLDTLNLTPAERTIARALQEYGMYLVDNAGEYGVSLYAVDPKSFEGDPYDGMFPAEDYPALSRIPLASFRVLALPEQDASWRRNVRLQGNRCTRFA
ncbi:hypothetical protein AUJ68_02520 [Candidatus Woesearchaeota archaeon CG1_02_57_44]|nr:MAG: hypothetical protein AUJ68_02520 [Candidatus Woesearchaeota archaeon CG1_02_57_44]